MMPNPRVVPLPLVRAAWLEVPKRAQRVAGANPETTDEIARASDAAAAGSTRGPADLWNCGYCGYAPYGVPH